MTMTWQDGRRLASLQTNGKNIQYTYDADGLRVTQTVDGIKHTYQYIGGLLMHETRGDISFSYDYDSYGHLSCIHYMWANGSSWKFYVACNSRGDVTAIYAADGTLRAKYTYDSWGNTLSIIDRYGNNIVALGDEATAADNIGALNRIRYRGYYYDNESGLYYLQSRYYDPQVKRFVNADGYVSTGQGLLASNMFAYCGNNPVNMADPTGESGIAVAFETLRGFIVAITIALGAAAMADEDDARSIATEVEITISNIFSRNTAWDQEQEIVGPQPAPVPQPTATAAARVAEIAVPKAVAAEAVEVEEQARIPQYFEATRVFFKDPMRRSEVIIGRPLTYVEALLRVSMGLDIMCLHQGAAIAIAKLYPYNVGPENHGRGKLGIYYDHYHPNRHSHVHIWYFGPTIINE